MAPTQPSGSATEALHDSRDILSRIQVLAVIGCALIVLYALRFWCSGDVLRILGVGVLVAAAALTAGVLTGFIFGIPREGDTKKHGERGATEPAASDEDANPVTPNSNLVEISDWLTKIIVGVGLVELKSIPEKLGELSYYVGRSLQPAQCGGTPCPDLILSGQSIGLAIMIFYFALGFLWGFIWTRLNFQRDLEERNRKLRQENRNLRLDKEAIDLIVLAEKCIDEGKQDEAMKWINEALASHPNDGRAVLVKGMIFKRQAESVPEAERNLLLGQALACANRAIDLMPPEARAEPIYNKACYQELLGLEKREVLATLQAAFELNPGLRTIAKTDKDLKKLWKDPEFERLTSENPAQSS